MKKENESIARWISILHRQFQIYLNKELKDYDINSSEYIFLVNLYERDGISQEQLSANLFINKAATTRAISRLEKLGYLHRTRDPMDSRAYLVTLTVKGLEMRDFIKTKLSYWTQIISTGLTTEEADDFKQKIKQMSMNALAVTKGDE
ncbi:MarR family winged helix-turn-helix transcriptional regulator [Pseudalkalibacillus salsuginis]|uniref:MarR family winged helix-turn-helix transcriptional regulator n=1 Tax=Pseudalkalibacillus salsuginis TaxID=2910972 RepID=UPI001F1C84B8|nr:MarR family transcriptional regulator [Pseudalkalibacillus salsuginis]MCF6411313.1 MarR family transcriptional regulator [Pseudalkalibacillus salsuginis]